MLFKNFRFFFLNQRTLREALDQRTTFSSRGHFFVLIFCSLEYICLTFCYLLFIRNMILLSEALSTATTICHTTFFAGRKVELKYIETRKRDVRARHSIHINFHVKTCTRYTLLKHCKMDTKNVQDFLYGKFRPNK